MHGTVESTFTLSIWSQHAEEMCEYLEESSLFDGRWRRGVDSGVAPWGARLGRWGITPNFLTGLGLISAAACAVAVGTGHLVLGATLFLLSALPDLLDGAVARATKAASSRGAYFDSVADRVSDSLYLFGIAWYLADTKTAQLALLPMAVLAVSAMIPYQRAKAEALGFHAKGGLLERAERMILLGIAIAVPITMIPILWVMLVLSAVTAVQRFVKVWRQASSAVVPRRRVLVGTRWEDWRTQYVETLRARKEERIERRQLRRATRERRRAARSSRWTRP